MWTRFSRELTTGTIKFSWGSWAPCHASSQSALTTLSTIWCHTSLETMFFRKQSQLSLTKTCVQLSLSQSRQFLRLCKPQNMALKCTTSWSRRIRSYSLQSSKPKLRLLPQVTPKPQNMSIQSCPLAKRYPRQKSRLYRTRKTKLLSNSSQTRKWP